METEQPESRSLICWLFEDVYMRYALIGCGRIAVNHLHAAINNNLEVTSVCDIVPENIETLLNKCQIQNANNIKKYSDYKKMLTENKLDLAAIATDSGCHAEIALYCIDKGINIIIEKPIAMSIKDADEIIKRSEQNGVIVSACHQNRYNIAVQKVKEALKKGRFGKISHGTAHVRWNRGVEYYKQAGWRGSWASDGGALMNQCLHAIDLIYWIMNDEIDEVYGVTRRQFHDYIEAEDLGVAIIKFKNGTIATIEGTTNVYPQNLEETLYLFGEHGTVKLGGKSVNTIEIWDFADADEKDTTLRGYRESTVNVYGNGHTGLYTDMINAIKTNSKPMVDAYEGKAALELVLAIYKSQKEGKAIKFPLNNFASIDMIGEFK